MGVEWVVVVFVSGILESGFEMMVWSVGLSDDEV